MKRTMKTTKAQIVEWCMANINECGYGVDASEMATRCFRCGYERETERCHVIPHSLGGEDTPSNYRLLCSECHLEAPNVNDPNAMDEWIRDTCVLDYDMFWKIREAFWCAHDDTSVHWGEKINYSTGKWLGKKMLEHLNISHHTFEFGNYKNALKP